MLQNHRSVLSGTSGRSNSGQGGGFTAVLVDRSTHHELEPIQYIAKFIRRLGQVGIPVFLRHTTDDTIVIFGPGKVLEQPDFISPGPPLHFGPGEALFPQPPVDPGDKEHVAGPCLDGAGPGKEIFREGIPDRPHTQLIAGLLLLEQPDHIQHSPPVIFCKINPAKVRRHLSTSSFFMERHSACDQQGLLHSNIFILLILSEQGDTFLSQHFYSFISYPGESILRMIQTGRPGVPDITIRATIIQRYTLHSQQK